MREGERSRSLVAGSVSQRMLFPAERGPPSSLLAVAVELAGISSLPFRQRGPSALSPVGVTEP